MEKELTYISSKGYVPEAVWLCLSVCMGDIPSTVVVFLLCDGRCFCYGGPVFCWRTRKRTHSINCNHLRNGTPLSRFLGWFSTCFETNIEAQKWSFFWTMGFPFSIGWKNSVSSRSSLGFVVILLKTSKTGWSVRGGTPIVLRQRQTDFINLPSLKLT